MAVDQATRVPPGEQPRRPPRQEMEHKARQAAHDERGARRRARSNLLDFTTYTKPEYHVSWHHRLIARLMDDLVEGRVTRAVCMSHPRSGKSELTSRRLPAYVLGRFPDAQIIACSYSSDLSSRMNRDVQRVMESPAYRRLFPETQLFGKNVRTVAGGTWMRNSDLFEVVGRKGGYRSAGVGGGITGMGFDFGLIDDPIKSAAEARSDTIRESQWEWMTSDFLTRQMPGARILITLTRWHYDDIVGRLLKLAEEDSRTERWSVLRLPAIAEEGGHPEDPRKEGEALWPERYNVDFLEKQKSALGPYAFACTPAETPILMGDWTHKAIADVRAGDEVVGFYKGTPQARARLVPATVTRVMSYVGMVCELTMESGRTARCTPCHRWYTRRKGYGHKEYLVPKVGRRLCYVQPCDYPALTDEERMMWAWLSGIVDGEGHVGHVSPTGRAVTRILSIGQSPDANPDVFARIGEVLTRLGLPHAVNVRQRPGKPKWGRGGEYVVHDIGTVFPRLIAYHRPAKWRQMVSALFGRGGRFVRERDAVRSIRHVGIQPVYALETTTGNYVAWGYASSNSLYQQRPTPREGGLFTEQGLSFLVDAPPAIVRNRVRAYDKGYAAEGDWTVGVLMSRTAEGIFTVEDVARFRLPPHERNRRIKQIAEDDDRRFGKRVPVVIEQPPGAGSETTGLLVRELAGHVVKAVRPVGDKSERAEPFAAQCGAGNVRLVRGPWIAAYKEEALTFPGGANDDQIDASSQAFAELVLRARINVGV